MRPDVFAEQLVHPDDRHYVAEALGAVIASDDPSFSQQVEGRLLRRDGQVRHVLVIMRPVREADGKVIKVIGTTQDITERKQVEEERERAGKFREIMLGVLSHDLRTPLNAVALSAGLLLRSKRLEGQDHEAVRVIETAMRRMNRMIADLLDLTRLRLGGGLVLQPEVGDVNRICSTVRDEVRAAHPERAIECAFDARGDGVWDSDRLHQVFTNLVVNAVHYGRPDAPVRFSTRDADDGVVVEIHNHGEPIPEHMLAKIFEPFRRAETARASPQGLGLGLFIVDQIVRAHHGEVTVESSAVAGTTFRIRLPRRPPEG